MGPKVTAVAADRHRVLPEVRPEMLKADLRKAETGDFRAQIGSVLVRARSLAGWSLKELAGKVDRDPRQVARWESGEERAQLDVLFSVQELQQPLVIALAELAGGVEVETTVRIRRTA